MSETSSRRTFLTATASASALVASGLLNRTASAADNKPKLKKAVKFGMIGGNGSIEEKFTLIKSLGFQGVEMDSPSSVNRDEAVKASKSTGIEIHGVVDSVHWNQRLSDPDPAVRAAPPLPRKRAAGIVPACTIVLHQARPSSISPT